MIDLTTQALTLDNLRTFYQQGVTPAALIDEVYRRIAAYDDPAVWIHVLDQAQVLEAIAHLPADQSNPLWGVPFAIKDNIDAAGVPTTAGCPDYGFLPDADAPVVAQLKAAGALLIGKTNMDQFATGLVGTRSPHGAARSVFNKEYVSGGSSSGSAVAVAAGLVSFSLGTDTAGSGRVPAMFNGLVGVKPTRGLLSVRGVVPACESLDCVSIFAHSSADGTAVRKVAEGVDSQDPWSRPMTPASLHTAAPVIAVPTPESREFFGDTAAQTAFEATLDRVTSLGWTITEVDYTPFRQAAALLYGGPRVAERYAAVGAFVDEHYDACDPTVAKIIAGGRDYTAADLFKDNREIERLKKIAINQLDGADAFLLPTAPTQYTVDAVNADPIQLNANLGTYTNFVNLFDMAAIAVPAGMTATGFPFSVTLVAKAFSDDAIAYLADQLHHTLPEAATLPTVPAPAAGKIHLAVVGAHLKGMPLNVQLQDRHASLLETTTTAPTYELYALAKTTPTKPGLVRVTDGGTAIEVEVWELDATSFGTFTQLVPPPLAIGNVELADARWVKGFVCEPAGLDGATDITHLGGWRAYMANK